MHLSKNHQHLRDCIKTPGLPKRVTKILERQCEQGYKVLFVSGFFRDNQKNWFEDWWYTVKLADTFAGHALFRFTTSRIFFRPKADLLLWCILCTIHFLVIFSETFFFPKIQGKKSFIWGRRHKSTLRSRRRCVKDTISDTCFGF